MERIRALAVLAAVVTALTATGAPTAFSNGGGNSSEAPGQERARQNCTESVARFDERNHPTKNGPKAPDPAPTNCDHVF